MVQENKLYIQFQNGGNGGNLGFLIGMILALFNLHVAPILPTKLESIGLSVQEKKYKTDFQDGNHLGFPIGMILPIFFIYKSPRYVLLSFKSFGFLGQENMSKQIFKMAATVAILDF